jgi:hypothetical protein
MTLEITTPFFRVKLVNGRPFRKNLADYRRDALELEPEYAVPINIVCHRTAEDYLRTQGDRA